MVKRACLFKDPTTPTTPTMPTMPTTISTATAYRKTMAEATTAKEGAASEKEVDRVLMQPVVAEPAYPNLVSNIK